MSRMRLGTCYMQRYTAEKVSHFSDFTALSHTCAQIDLLLTCR